jgi:hypothetical protein
MSVILNGSDQYFARSAEPTVLGIGNAWTLAGWVKPRANKEHATIFSTATKEENRIELSVTPLTELTTLLRNRRSQLRVLIKDADGTTIKHYGFQDTFLEETWTHFGVTWDGNELLAYVSGTAAITGTVLTNVTGTMTDTPRKVFYGNAIQGAATFSGTVGHLGFWGTVLSSGSLNEIAGAGHSANLLTNSGSYVESANLQHWWRPGDDPGDIGKDYAIAGTPINIGLDARRINGFNIVGDTP